jgi:L-2-hydroxyglutarate oxidase LhgO
MMATSPAEEVQLAKLFRQGQANGAPVQMLSPQEMHRIEPNLVATSAFFSPSTGTVDSYGLMKFFLGKAQDKGASLACRAEAIAIKKIPDGYEVRVKGNPDYTFITRILINSAGLYSDRVAELAGIDTRTANYRVRLSKGEFYSVGGHKDRHINHLIYPVPMPNGPGIHICFDAERKLRLGPLFSSVEEVDYKMDDSRRSDFLNSSIMRALPIIEPSDLEPESTGIMVQLSNVAGGFNDFIIRHEHERALPGLINLIGIGSPGLTSSPAIAKYVRRMVEEILYP